MSDTVRVVINQQQAQMLDRLIAEGMHGTSYGEVIRSGFLHFCRDHPELVARRPPSPPDDEEPI